MKKKGSIKTDALLFANREVGLHVNAEKTKHMLMSGKQIAGQNRHIHRGNKSFEVVGQLRYLRQTLTDQNWMHEGTERKSS
jgi:hypothetical protein